VASEQEISLYRILSGSPEKWFTHSELAKTSGIGARTVRSHTLKFAKHGLVECRRVFPGFRYRWIKKPSKQAQQYLDRLRSSEEVFRG